MILFALNGAVFGLMAGGWAGLILGAIVGYVIGEFMLRVLLPIGQGGSQAHFVTFAVMGALCKADGVVTPDEIRVGEQYFDKLALSDDPALGLNASASDAQAEVMASRRW